MKDRVFRDPVHGLIEVRGPDRELCGLMETLPFQRLRRIHQMGFAWLVYPGAEHSRFGHALGAFHLAGRVAAALDLPPRVARHVKVAALLHDVGHGPFSHSWEQVFGGDSHEDWGVRIVAEEPALAAALQALETDFPRTLQQFWDKSYRPSFARKLVSSQLDVDRLDYLLRDGHYSGAGYAAYDLDWILHALRIAQVRPGSPDPADLVIDYRRGRFAVEQYLFARTYMYAQVYHHKTVRAAEWMFLKLLRRFAEIERVGGKRPAGLEGAARLARGERLSVGEYLELDDVMVTAAMSCWAGRGGPPAEDSIVRDLAARLLDRQLFKTFELGEDVAVIERLRESVAEAARRRFGEAAGAYYQFDTAPAIDYQAKDGDELHVVGHPRYDMVPLSRLLEDLPLGRRTTTVRLVSAPELVDAFQPLVDKAFGGVDRSWRTPAE
jgi:HD superfamily phosphohydrolase